MLTKCFCLAISIASWFHHRANSLLSNAQLLNLSYAKDSSAKSFFYWWNNQTSCNVILLPLSTVFLIPSTAKGLKHFLFGSVQEFIFNRTSQIYAFEWQIVYYQLKHQNVTDKIEKQLCFYHFFNANRCNFFSSPLHQHT